MLVAKMNDMKPILSVIIPVYNVKEYLDDCLRTIIAQTLQDIEIILVDDGSSDGSSEICDGFAAKDCRIKVVHQENQGAGMARNAGLEIATGEYVTFVDGDDCLDVTAFGYMIDVIKANDLDALRISYNKFKDGGNLTNSNSTSHVDIYTEKEDIRLIQMSLFSRPYNKSIRDINLGGAPWGIVIKADIIKNNNIRFMSEREIISEDYIFNYECLNYINRIGKSYKTLYHYRITPNSITRSPKLDNITRTITTCELMTKLFLRDGFDVVSKYYAMGYCIDVLRVHLKNVFVSSMQVKNKLEWAKQQSELSYFKSVYDEYPWKRLKLKHRIGFYLFVKGHIKWLYFMIVGQEILRGNLKLK